VALKKGARVIIAVEGDDPGTLERLLRTQMDLAVARQQITEGQYREMYFSSGVQMTDAEALIDDIPEAEDDGDPMADDIEDFDAFVKGEPEEEVVSLPVPADMGVVEEPIVLDDDVRRDNPPLALADGQTSTEHPVALPGHDWETEQQRMAEETEVFEETKERIEDEMAAKATMEAMADEGPAEEFDEEPTAKAPPRRAPRRTKMG
jgi:hypothetical protein